MSVTVTSRRHSIAFGGKGTGKQWDLTGTQRKIIRINKVI